PPAPRPLPRVDSRAGGTDAQEVGLGSGARRHQGRGPAGAGGRRARPERGLPAEGRGQPAARVPGRTRLAERIDGAADVVAAQLRVARSPAAAVRRPGRRPGPAGVGPRLPAAGRRDGVTAALPPLSHRGDMTYLATLTPDPRGGRRS